MNRQPILCPLCNIQLYVYSMHITNQFYTTHTAIRACLNFGPLDCKLKQFLYNTDKHWNICKENIYLDKLTQFISNKDQYEPIIKQQIIKEL